MLLISLQTHKKVKTTHNMMKRKEYFVCSLWLSAPFSFLWFKLGSHEDEGLAALQSAAQGRTCVVSSVPSSPLSSAV